MTDATLLKKLEALPPDKRQEVSDFIDFLLQRSQPATATEPFYGSWKDLAVELEAEDLNEARRELWSGFPREDLP